MAAFVEHLDLHPVTFAAGFADAGISTEHIPRIAEMSERHPRASV